MLIPTEAVRWSTFSCFSPSSLFNAWDYYDMFGKLCCTPIYLLSVFNISTFISKRRMKLQTGKLLLWLQSAYLFKFLERNQRSAWLSFTILYADKTLPNENNQSGIKYNQANSNSLQLVDACVGELFWLFRYSVLTKKKKKKKHLRSICTRHILRRRASARLRTHMHKYSWAQHKQVGIKHHLVLWLWHCFTRMWAIK